MRQDDARTSGVLWGAGLRAVGRELGNAGTPTPDAVAAAVRGYLDAIVSLGKAEIGDKTLVDAVTPFSRVLSERVAAGDALGAAWASAGGRPSGAGDRAALPEEGSGASAGRAQHRDARSRGGVVRPVCTASRRHAHRLAKTTAAPIPDGTGAAWLLGYYWADL